MNRQVERARARSQAKIDDAAFRLAARAAVRKEKGLTPLPKTPKANYRYEPVMPRGKSYPFSSKRQNAKYTRLAAGSALAAAA
ncbi:hypothetical protein [Sinorhizobium meliloti]|uniref:hypothetical protein n=1 Tax=Rhizobium meliloti TaxID=382 RepID=UPI000FD95E88|nr:hypothetical protein [Sinorhizobium meliloti]RVL38015.1 hypothetical protein CN148_11910 [Sinorhizobium meliloti]